MVTVKILTGPHAGSVRSFEGGDQLSIFEILAPLVELDRSWKVDFSLATADETYYWGVADFSAKAVRALIYGRRVLFRGTEYRILPGQDPEEIVGNLEDIVSSGKCLFKTREDDDGLVVIEICPEDMNPTDMN